ncbi:MAG: clan AA aspartic protease, partial [Rhodospirillales bacterium]|nr:clan AA aspartic protease [Acetobacter sp.]
MIGKASTNLQPITALLPIAVTAWLTGCAPAGPALCVPELAGEMPVVLRGNVPSVPVRINGQEATLVVDTGATDTVLTSEAVQRLGLALDYRGDVTVTGAGGSTRNFPVLIDSLTLGGVTLRDQRALVAGLSLAGRGRVDGLLGGRQLRSFDVDLD